ncbi:MAG: bestrophin [Planctomycetes bacterium]|nr:bestrophin [Planctomycetota bacterium]
MIVRERPGMFRLFLIWRGSILPRVLPEMLVTTAIAVALTGLESWRPGLLPEMPSAPYALLGLAFSIFLGFRNSACYDRWWEARKQWGQLVVEQRSFARDSIVLGVDVRRRLLRRGLAFVHALSAQLRGHDAAASARPWLDAAEADALVGSRNPADALLRRQGEELAAALREGRIDAIVYRGLCDRLQSMSGVQAACERIRHTPLPFAYTLLLHRTAHLFCFLLPLGIVHAAGWATPVLTAVVAYTFFGLDALGDQLEEPFGTLENDLPLDAIARVIEIDVREAMGERDLPPPLRPQNFLLT